MVSYFSWHFLQLSLVIIQVLQNVLLIILVLKTWSWMSVKNPVVPGKSLPTFSQAFDTVQLTFNSSKSVGIHTEFYCATLLFFCVSF